MIKNAYMYAEIYQFNEMREMEFDTFWSNVTRPVGTSFQAKVHFIPYIRHKPRVLGPLCSSEAKVTNSFMFLTYIASQGFRIHFVPYTERNN